MFAALLAKGFWLVMICSGLPLIAASAAGLIIALIQTATQIQEQSITYVVKLGAAVAVLTLLAGWYSATLLGFMTELLAGLAHLGKL